MSAAIELAVSLWFNGFMKKYNAAKMILIVLLVIMAGMIVFAGFYQEAFVSLLKNTALLSHTRFMHIVAISLFFSNAVVGIFWERQSLASGSKAIILHTYDTVTLLDSVFSSPMIIFSVIGGLSLSFNLGDLWQIGWLSVSFLLFLLSGVVWIVSDIPTQYKVKKILARLDPEDQSLPAELIHLLKRRWWISMAGVLPLIAVFILMVYKPDITAVADWFR